MKESEARTKWCPMARITVVDTDTENNRSTIGNETNNCIASACMAWRQIYPSLADLAVGTHMDGEPEGYCGLAGRLS